MERSYPMNLPTLILLITCSAVKIIYDLISLL
jgi:hypothetical protein